ncbi:hypothetical protein E9531_13160 [Lampropedia puyangensis]|uniref:YiaAB two helix domain-containing protein n=1 Tax=Lampropedia puyangensis TaxID=1330072 RepID=A0A4S8EYM6_9BURK|nr:YiaA/YiaB family inner membrane protein [Lampropedia puyangensis]THT99024.1 hypothetical protein E9531_13160 [Lampropedia puyangensis]
MASPLLGVQRDTAQWHWQTWISFGLAIGLSAIGLLYLPGQAIEKAFMAMGYVFCLSTAFVLSKFVRDAQSPWAQQQDTPLWRLVVWGSFAFAMGITAWGLLNLTINPTYKAYLAVSWLFMMSSGFTLAKMLRDRHEADCQFAAQPTVPMS